MSNFYKMDPAAWDFGTAELTLEQEGAYLRIVNAIHKHDQPVPNNDRVLAGMFRCSTRKARTLVNALVEAGKIRVEDGRITNDRAISDLVHRGFVSISRAESGAKGGRTRANNAAKALENNEQDQANASSRIEENRIEENSSAAAARARARAHEAGNPPDKPTEDPPTEDPRTKDPKPDRAESLVGQLTHALGFDHGGSCPPHWITPDAALIVSRWKTDLGLTDAEIVDVAVGSSRAYGSPVRRPSVLNEAMARYAAQKAAPPLTPSATASDSRRPASAGHGIEAQIPERFRQ